MVKTTLMAAAITLVSLTAASAAVLTVDLGTISGTSTTNSISTLDVPITFTGDQFYPGLGTLTGLQIELSGRLSSFADLYSFRDYLGLPNVTPVTNQVQVRVNAAGFYLPSVVVGSCTANLFNTSSNIYQDSCGLDSFDVTVSTSSSANLSFISSNNPADREIDLQFFPRVLLSTSPVRDFPSDDGTSSVRASFDVKETFIYTPVPEPASLALVAAGLLGLGFVAVRRKA